MIGLITGVSAALSMSSSEFFSKRQEKDMHKAVTSSIYTGFAYIITVILLVLPFLILTNPYINLVITILTAILIIFLFNFYISTAKELPFKERFLEMTVISLGVAFVSFIIGWLIKIFMGINL
jgi:VIT1/CCC1 family predicted Fe2+/Mn2+ transporter